MEAQTLNHTRPAGAVIEADPRTPRAYQTNPVPFPNTCPFLRPPAPELLRTTSRSLSTCHAPGFGRPPNSSPHPDRENGWALLWPRQIDRLRTPGERSLLHC